MYVKFQIILKDFLDYKGISENSIGSYAILKLLRKYVTMHGPQNVKKSYVTVVAVKANIFYLPVELHFSTSKIS